MAQNLQQLLDARDNAGRLYNVAQRAPENNLENVHDETHANQIHQRLYNANQAYIVAAEAYRDAIQTDNNATPEQKQQARDYVSNIEVLPKPLLMGGRRRRSSTPRKSSSSRRRRSTKRRTASRKQQKRRRGSRRAH